MKSKHILSQKETIARQASRSRDQLFGKHVGKGDEWQLHQANK